MTTNAPYDDSLPVARWVRARPRYIPRRLWIRLLNRWSEPAVFSRAKVRGAAKK